MVDVLTLNYNDYDTTYDFIINHMSYSTINKIVVVDNCSTDDSYEKLKELENEKVEIVRSSVNGGYGAGNNIGIIKLMTEAQSKYILLANPDTLIDSKTLQILEDFLKENNDYAIVAPFMTNGRRVKQGTTAIKTPDLYGFIGSILIGYSKLFHPVFYPNITKSDEDVLDVGAVSGSLFLFDVQKFREIGLYDEGIFLYNEEITLALKLKRTQYKCALLTQHHFVHNHSVSVKKSYRKITDRHRLMIESYLYVLKNYYKANRMQLCIAQVCAAISLLERYIIISIRGN